MRQRVIFYKNIMDVVLSDGCMIMHGHNAEEAIGKFARGEINCIYAGPGFFHGWRVVVNDANQVEIDFKGEFDENEIVQCLARVRDQNGYSRTTNEIVDGYLKRYLDNVDKPFGAPKC